MPVTIPVALPTMAIEGLLLLQVPPAVASVKVVVKPSQRDELPDIGSAPLTVTEAVV